MMEDLAGRILSTGGVSSLMLAGVLYWLFKYYIPERDRLYRESLKSQQDTFKESLNAQQCTFLAGIGQITAQHEEHSKIIHARLDVIENKISEIK